MRRLVYSPNVHAYIKADEGVVDISPWIVSGSINRKINQVSTAQITLRNPIKDQGPELLWTDHVRAVDNGTGPRFHPMDPIMIVMTRLQGRPVQVFTGYLDKAPYLQLYPGLCTLEASCTLKRLLYTQWDAALPFVAHFLRQYGWQIDGDNGIVNKTAEGSRLDAQTGTLQGLFNDGSIGALLAAVLINIGEWDQNNIWIEALPPQIKDIVLQIWADIAPSVQADVDRFKGLISDILGSNSMGTGAPGGSSVAPTNLNLTGTGQAYRVYASREDDAAGMPGSCGPLPGDRRGWSELSRVGLASDQTPSDWGIALGHLPCGTVLRITNPNNGRSTTAKKVDIGAGNGAPPPVSMGVYPTTRAEIGMVDNQDLVIQRVDGGPLNPLRGTPVGTPSAPKPSVGGSRVSSQHGGSVTHAAFQPSVQTNARRQGNSPGGRTGSGGTSTTRFEVIIQAANAITQKNFPYAYGGGHGQPGIPSTDIRGNGKYGFDCSGAVDAVLFAAGLTQQVFATNDEKSILASVIDPGLDHSAKGVNIFIKDQGGANDHTFMQIGGRYFGTSGVVPTDPAGGAGWFQGTPSAGYLAGFQQFHIKANLLTETTANALPAAAGGPGGSATIPGGATGSGGSSGGSGVSAVAAAFATTISLPSIFEQAEAVAFTGRRSFMADQPLFPFVEQLCQASMRSFMSMPNGNFFAFFPDYFGIFGRKYYWEIEDIEIIDGRIDLSDDALVTHVAVAGDVTQFHKTVDVIDLLHTSGIFSIFEAFQTGFIGTVQDHARKVKITPGHNKLKPEDKRAALGFLQKYGARPYVEQVPAIRSPFFELFYAFQKFMLMWAKQFQTTFELTFMPELFPGGLIAFPSHHVQCYIEEVAHNWDYTQGFTTTVNLSAPSVIAGDADSRSNISEGLARPQALSTAGLPSHFASSSHGRGDKRR